MIARNILTSALLMTSGVVSVSLDLSSDDSIKEAMKTVAYGAMKYYKGNETGEVPGYLPEPYYWWEAGALFGTIMNYWHYTGDDQYNDDIIQGMMFQSGPEGDYQPANQSIIEGNDDQVFWAMSALNAAEIGFPDPPKKDLQWIDLAARTYEAQLHRWDTSVCNGGLHWQLFIGNLGWSYKNTISQGGLFNMAARLGAYTGNHTYWDTVDLVWNWVEGVNLIGDEYQFYDGTESADDKNCSDVNHIQWTYNAGIFLHGSAFMYNHTTGAEQQKWEGRVNGILKGIFRDFFTGPDHDIMIEVACERGDPSAPEDAKNPFCNNDQRSFKAYLARWLAETTKLVPSTAGLILPYLQTNAKLAAASCSGGSDGVTCGNRWWKGASWDGLYGVGEQMDALEVIQGNLVKNVPGPFTADNGGTSKANPKAAPKYEQPVTNADKGGAGFITAMLLAGTLGIAAWMIHDEKKPASDSKAKKMASKWRIFQDASIAKLPIFHSKNEKVQETPAA